MDNNKLTFTKAILFLSPYIKKYKGNFFKFYTGWLFDSIISVILPILYGIMLDEIVYRHDIQTFMKIGLLVVIVSIFSCLLFYLIYAQHHYLFNMYAYAIRKDIFKHLNKVKAKHMNDNRNGEMISYLTNYSEECVHFIIRGVIHQINKVIVILFIIINLFRVDVIIGLVVLIAAIIAFIVNLLSSRINRMFSDKLWKYNGIFEGWLYEIINSIKNIKILGATDYTLKLFRNKHNDIYNEKNKLNYIETAADISIQGVNLLTQLIIYVLAGYMSLKGNITIGTLLVVVSYYDRLKDQIGSFISSHIDAQRRVAVIQKIYDFLSLDTEESRSDKKEISIPKGEIALKNISFSYDREVSILKNFNLTIKPGIKMALVGSSGCGKTTVAHLLSGLYIPDEGDIIIDGATINKFSSKSIRKKIGIIEQNIMLFDGSIKSNLLLGNKKAKDEDIRNACKQAGILDFIDSLPDGFNTFIGAEGINLSGGQKQRLGIARIYLKNPQIIIFDEATASLDAKTEDEITEAWENVLLSRTSIVISHRLNTVMHCNEVAILKDGVLIETGDPKELIKNSLNFRTLFAVEECTV